MQQQQPVTFHVLNPPTPSHTKDLFRSDGHTRLDGRNSDHLRNLHLSTGFNSQASGSAYLEMGDTKVVCSIHGPYQKHGHGGGVVGGNEAALDGSGAGGVLNCDFKFASFSSAFEPRKTPSQDRTEKELSLQMVESLEVSVRVDKYPKSVIDVVVLVLQNSGGVLACALTCASLALSDAGIEMYDMIAACSASALPSYPIEAKTAEKKRKASSQSDPIASGLEIIVDANEIEERAAIANVTVAALPSLNEMTQVYQTGELEHQQSLEAIGLCLEGCSLIYGQMAKCLVESTQKKSKKIAQAEE